MIGNCDCCDRTNVPVAGFSATFAHSDGVACFICRGEDDPDPYCELADIDSNQVVQPDLHMPGWPELRYHGRAKTDGAIWWWEERMEDGSVKRHPLQPYDPIASGDPSIQRTTSETPQQKNGEP